MTIPPPDKSPDRITPGQSPRADQPSGQPSQQLRAAFESYMQGAASRQKLLPAPSAPSGPTPMELPAAASQTGGSYVRFALSPSENSPRCSGTVGAAAQRPKLKTETIAKPSAQAKISRCQWIYPRCWRSKLGARHARAEDASRHEPASSRFHRL